MKKIILDYFLFITIVSFFLVGCEHKSNNDNNEKCCYGEIIRYDTYGYTSQNIREILISGESGGRMLFHIPDGHINDENVDILNSRVGDIVSITYINENNITNYTIIK